LSPFFVPDFLNPLPYLDNTSIAFVNDGVRDLFLSITRFSESIELKILEISF